MLSKIHFICDAFHNHWAETDGECIWLNAYKTYSDEILYKTLLHESLHGLVRRNGVHELPEDTEHRMMHLLDSSLL